ncbi:hypothetical protein DVQ84_09810 [Yersinia enterocolitica]|nr:hypothetical protein [Yersinia enterocolitica]EKN6031562.1 hypothetical protein [Yersinia enterocolitica]EKN6069965.1 hypothetical protein [Yersinia enterocolitica]EKN6100311.1 hypothetical protein [Yersinia enterocolitica]EKN6185254.1 hypothetical protein [Yersinia enterocolitica]
MGNKLFLCGLLPVKRMARTALRRDSANYSRLLQERKRGGGRKFFCKWQIDLNRPAINRLAQSHWNCRQPASERIPMSLLIFLRSRPVSDSGKQAQLTLLQLQGQSGD